METIRAVFQSMKPITNLGISRADVPVNVLWQKTLENSVSCTGIGVHSGKAATLTLHPAKVGSGYVFVRTDMAEQVKYIPARWDMVTDTAMCTRITNEHGVSVSTIEHVMAALAGCGIHNALIEVDGPEVPIMDGSSALFVDLIHQASVHLQRKSMRRIKILKTLEVQSGNAIARLQPSYEPQLTMQFNANGRLSEQLWSLTYYPDHDHFGELISSARTFGFYEDAQHLWAKGLAQGASLENTVVIKDGKVMNEEGLRYSDEFVRHKMLDAIGDLSLAGAPILGHFHGINSGHSLNNQLLRALFADTSAWCFDI